MSCCPSTDSGLVGASEFEHLAPIEWGAESTVFNGLALGFLIGFRNNHAYDRWWEARKLWGQLINESRNLCLKVRVAGEHRASRPGANRPAGDRVSRRPSRITSAAATGPTRRPFWNGEPRWNHRSTSRSVAGAYLRDDGRGLAARRTHRRLGPALARWAGQEPDGYLRRLRADSQHAALVILPRPAPPRDRPLPGRRPVLSDRGHRDCWRSRCSFWRLISCWASRWWPRRSKSHSDRRRQPAAGTLLRDHRNVSPRYSPLAGKARSGARYGRGRGANTRSG